MPGTKEGGKKAAATIKAKYGDNFYADMGSKGGKVTGVAKGFAIMDEEKRRAAGQKGGSKPWPKNDKRRTKSTQ